MKSMPNFDNGKPPGNINPPFEFDLHGNITISASAAKIQGINEFARHYVSEWLLWHQSGCLGTRVCDIAALIVSAIGCQFLQNYSLDHKIEWIEQVFLLDQLGKKIPLRIDDYSDATLAVLSALRPSICQQAETLSPDACDALLQLALPIERMMVLGGDHRLLVDPDSQLNGYGCRPFPRPEAITFSSSTATSISPYAYEIAEKRRKQFILASIKEDVQHASASLAQEVREGIYRQLDIASEIAEVVITASGTDSFLIAHGFTRLISKRTVISLIVGVDESGSGVKLALQERHFADDTALACTVLKGQPLSGEIAQEQQINIPVRDESGDAIPSHILDNQVKDLVISHIEAGNFVVIHAMNHSKLGYSGPSRALLIELKQRFKEQLCIVVDACQMRLDREELVDYLKLQMIVIITGSKFFTGPPFSGAILIPDSIAQQLLSQELMFSIGFNSYCAKEDFPKRLQHLLQDGSKRFNLGPLFRWVAAIAEMQRYYEIPRAVRVSTVSEFCERVKAILLAEPVVILHNPNPELTAAAKTTASELSGRRMIFPFFLTFDKNGVKTLCSEEQVRQIYALLNQDCSTLFSHQNAREFRLLAQMCHVGQPVALTHPSGIHTAVLRISIGVRIFSESFEKQTGKIVNALIEDEIWQIGVTLGKISLLLDKISDNEMQLE
jgi:hypothetical protein